MGQYLDPGCCGWEKWCSGGPLSSSSSADSDWAAVISFRCVIAGQEWTTVVSPAPYTGAGVCLWVYCLSWIYWIKIGIFRVQGVSMRWVVFRHSSISSASVLAAAFVLFNAQVVGDGSSLSCPCCCFLPWISFLLLGQVSQKWRLGYHLSTCCEIHLEHCRMLCEKSSGLCKYFPSEGLKV